MKLNTLLGFLILFTLILSGCTGTKHSDIPVIQRLLDDLKSVEYVGSDKDIVLTRINKETMGNLTLPSFFMPMKHEIYFTQVQLHNSSRLHCYIGVKNVNKDIPIKISVINSKRKEVHQSLLLRKNEFTKLIVPLDFATKSQKGIKIVLSTKDKDFQGFVYMGNPIIVTPTVNKKIPDVFLLTVDTLAASHISSYGYKKPTTRYLDKLISKEGIFFKNAFSSSPWTRPSYASIFTGLPPSLTKVFETKPGHEKLIGGNNRLEDEFQTIAEILQQVGYLTVGIYTVANLSPVFGFAQGFDIYINIPDNRRFTAKASSDTFINILKDYGDVPIFVFLNIIDPHTPYSPPPRYVKSFLPETHHNIIQLKEFNIGGGCYECEDYKSKLDDIRALYDGEIAYTDYHLFRIISAIKKIGLYDSSIIIFTADHGEELGEHGGVGHGFKLYNEHIKVPLWIRYSKRLPISKDISTNVGTISLLPTILDLVDYNYSPNRFWSPSLRPIIFDERNAYPIFAEILNHNKAPEVQRAIIFGDYKLIEFQFSKILQLFNLKDDPSEKNNILNSQDVDQEVLKKMHNLLQDEVMRLKDKENIPYYYSTTQNSFHIENNKKLIEDLKSLGYLQ